MAAASPESIREATQQVLTSGDYHLDREDNPLQPLWERIRETIFSVLESIANFFSFLQGLPGFLQWIIISALFVILALLVAHIIYSVIVAMRPGRNPRAKLSELAEHRDDPRQWESLAVQMADEARYVEGARLLLRASLFRLEDYFDRPFRRATTNREYLRKYRKLPVLDAVKQLVDTIDRKWYGEESCDRDDYDRCSRSHLQILELVQSRRENRQEPA